MKNIIKIEGYSIIALKIDATDKDILDAFEGILKAYIEIVPHEEKIKIYYPDNKFMLHVFLAEDICEDKSISWLNEKFYSAEDYLLERKQFIKLDREYSNIFLCIGVDKKIERLAYKIAKLLRCYVNQLFEIR